MFFVLSKILAFFLVPSNIVVALVLAGLILMLTRFRRAGLRLAAGSFLFLVVVGASPLGPALIAMLEDRFPPWQDGGAPVDGIVVLGGLINPDRSAQRGQLVLGGAIERATEAAALARRHPGARIVFTGGNPSLFGGPPEADYAVQLFEQLGVPASRIVLESRARTTAENATFTKELVKPKPGERWLLVTSAAHMPRSVGAFRKADFAVEPCPVDWHTARPPGLLRMPSQLLGGWGAIDAAAHEWVGLLAYWISGRSSALFPAPE
jgi:uncharacterized SAM-binding protein YcdF (DUF218 family)